MRKHVYCVTHSSVLHTDHMYAQFSGLVHLFLLPIVVLSMLIRYHARN